MYLNESRFGTGRSRRLSSDMRAAPPMSAEGYTRLGFGNQNKALVSRIECAARFDVIHSAGISLCS